MVFVGGKVEKRYFVFFLPLMIFIRADLLVERICLVVSGLLLKSVRVGPVVIGLQLISTERFMLTTEIPGQSVDMCHV